MAAIAQLVRQQVYDLACRATPADIDGWFRRVVNDLLALVAAAFEALRQLTAAFLGEHAQAEGHAVEPVLAAWNTEQVSESLRIRGPVVFKEIMETTGDPDQALTSMAKALPVAASRQALAGERRTVEATIEDSAEIAGWRRVGDGDPCAFCAMLISRGAVYKNAASAGDARFGGMAYHDQDGCTAVPLYEHEDEPAEVADLYQQWLDATRGKSGDDALRAWRRYWDSRGDGPTFDERADEAAAGDDARAAAPLSLLRPSAVRGRDALTPDEAFALSSYKGSGYSRVNPWLRAGMDDNRPDLARDVADLDAALARSPLRSDVVVHRGIVAPQVVFGGAAGVNLAGAEWTERAYVSTSTAEGQGRLFALLGGDGEAVVMRILVPAGTGAVELSNGDYESELLLRRGLRMRVVADTGPGTRPRMLDVEVIP